MEQGKIKLIKTVADFSRAFHIGQLDFRHLFDRRQLYLVLVAVPPVKCIYEIYNHIATSQLNSSSVFLRTLDNPLSIIDCYTSLVQEPSKS